MSDETALEVPTSTQHGQHTLDRAAALFRALSSPLRLAILAELTDGPKYVHELTDVLKISQPLASQHLRTLRDQNLVLGVRQGREIRYEIGDTHVTHIVTDAFAHITEIESGHIHF